MDLNLPLTRRRDPDYEAWLIFYGDLHVGTVGMRSSLRADLSQQSGRCQACFDQDGLDPAINSSVLPG
jgi:hypothetical protein